MVLSGGPRVVGGGGGNADQNPQAANVLPVDPRLGGTAALTANQAYFVKFRVLAPRLIGAITVFIGGTSSGNVDVGLFSGSSTLLTKIATSGSTVAGPANAAQKIAISPSWAVPGVDYFLAFVQDNGTNIVGRLIASGAGMASLDDSVLAKASSFPLGDTVASAVATTATPVLMGSPS